MTLVGPHKGIKMGRCREVQRGRTSGAPWVGDKRLASRSLRPRYIFLPALLCNRLSLGRVVRWRSTLKMRRSFGRSLPVRRLEAGVPGRALP